MGKGAEGERPKDVPVPPLTHDQYRTSGPMVVNEWVRLADPVLKNIARSKGLPPGISPEDVVQEAWSRLPRALAGKPDEYPIGGVITTMVRRGVADSWRRFGRQTEREVDLDEEHVTPRPDVADQVAQSVDNERVLERIENILGSERAHELYMILTSTTEDAAAELKIARSTVRTRKRRLLSQVRGAVVSRDEGQATQANETDVVKYPRAESREKEAERRAARVHNLAIIAQMDAEREKRKQGDS